MTLRWLVLALAGLAVVVADPALARSRKARPQCQARPVEFSWWGFWTNPRPRPNGCAPAVYDQGEYVGQDPDPFIRLQLKRDPSTGYSYDNAQ